MGVTKTDFVRGMQCPKMLWLDRHKPELREIPPAVQDRLDRGNDFGDQMMGIFGPYVEVQEYYPGTKHPDQVRMAVKTAELIAAGTKIICEAAFMDVAGNYCAVVWLVIPACIWRPTCIYLGRNVDTPTISIIRSFNIKKTPIP